MSWFKNISHQKNNLLSELLFQFNLPILILDGSYQIILANREAREQLFIQNDKNPQLSFLDFIPTKNQNQVSLLFKNIKMSGYSSFNTELLVPDAKQSFDIFCQYLSLESGQFFILMLNYCFSRSGDIKKLADLQRFEIIGRLASGFAHDFNNVLAAAIGYISLLQNENISPSKKSGYLEKLDSVMTDGAKSLREILIFSQTEEDKPVFIKLQDSVDQTLEFVRRLIRSNIKIHCTYSPKIATIYITARTLEQIIINILINARDAISGSGEISVTIDSEVSIEKDNDFNPQIPAGVYHLIRISDTGTGMSPHIRKKIFNPYFTTKKDMGGTGIGLFVVRQAMEEANGGIKVESSRSSGTTFTLAFPKAEEKEKVVLHAEEIPFPDRIRSVLIIEDDAEVAEVLTGILKNVHLHVVLRQSASEAVLLLQHESFDLILMDFGLPDTNGPDLFLNLKKQLPKVPILVMSGYSPAELNAHSPEIPVEAIIAKPFHLKDLVRKLLYLIKIN